MKTTVILQPGYIPWLGFWELLARCDTYVVYDDVQYTRRDWRNRNRIKAPAGPQWLSIPTLSKGRRGEPIREVEVDPSQNWKKYHLKALELNYKKATYFAPIYEQIKKIYEIESRFLVDYLWQSLMLIKSLLQIECDMIASSELGFRGAGRQERLIALCKRTEAQRYYNGAAGRDLYDPQSFLDAGIVLQFQQYQHPIYPQLWSDFISHLSVVDALFNCGAIETKALILSGSELLNSKPKNQDQTTTADLSRA